MKWRRKHSAPSSSRESLITSVFHLSWLVNLKQKRGVPEISSMKRRGELGFKSPNSSLLFGRFHNVGDFADGDGYWNGGRSVSNGGLKLNPVAYDCDEEFQIPISSFRSFGLREMEVPTRKGNGNFNEKVLIEMKKSIEEKKQGRVSDDFRSKRGCPESVMNGYNSRKTSHGSSFFRKKQAGEEEKSSKLMERDVFEIEPEIKLQIKDNNLSGKNSFSFPKLDQISVTRDCQLESPNGKMGAAETFKDKRIKEIKIKTEFHKKSPYTNGDSQGRIKTRTKALSPRTECKIRAIEDMKKKKAKTKLKMSETKRQIMDGRTVYDSFAEVKNSFNPQQDFRNSMFEMMTDKEIKRPEDLEELLSCYLKLNCHELHEMIIKVFRQVWFELNGSDKHNIKRLNKHSPIFN